MPRISAVVMTWIKVLATPMALILAAWLGPTNVNVRNVIAGASAELESDRPVPLVVPAPGAAAAPTHAPLPKGYRLIYGDDGRVTIVKELGVRTRT